MRSRLTTALTVIGALTVLVLAGNTVAIAATGQGFLLGKSNSANNITALTRTTSGSALKLQTASSLNAPLTVNGKGKVVNLNVDKVDGLEGGTRAYSWSSTGSYTGNRTFTLNGLPAGKYLITYDVYVNQLSSADGETAACYLSQSVGGSHYGGESNSQETATSYPALSATALMTQPTGGNLKLNCSVPSGATWSASAAQPVRITAIPLSGVTTKAPGITAKVTAPKAR